MHWFAGLEAVCRTDVQLRHHTWYRLGGPARWFLTPRDETELIEVLRRCRAHHIDWRLLGRGANVLVRDAGFDGAVIHLTGPFWEAVRYEGATVHAAGGALFHHLVKDTLKRGLCGLEALAGVPGSMGGIVRMNAGGKYGEIAQFVREVRVIEPDGSTGARARAAIGFRYRHTDLDGCTVTHVVLDLALGDAAAAQARFKTIWKEKYASQPPLSVRSAGCVFKNPTGQSAGRLIDQAGLKGCRIGGAEFSTIHANFIVASPDATAADVINLMQLAKDRVRSATGLELQAEVEIW